MQLKEHCLITQESIIHAMNEINHAQNNSFFFSSGHWDIIQRNLLYHVLRDQIMFVVFRHWKCVNKYFFKIQYSAHIMCINGSLGNFSAWALCSVCALALNVPFAFSHSALIVGSMYYSIALIFLICVWFDISIWWEESVGMGNQSLPGCLPVLCLMLVHLNKYQDGIQK